MVNLFPFSSSNVGHTKSVALIISYASLATPVILPAIVSNLSSFSDKIWGFEINKSLNCFSYVFKYSFCDIKSSKVS